MTIRNIIDSLMTDHGYTRERAVQAIADHASIIDGMTAANQRAGDGPQWTARDIADRIARAECPAYAD